MAYVRSYSRARNVNWFLHCWVHTMFLQPNNSICAFLSHEYCNPKTGINGSGKSQLTMAMSYLTFKTSIYLPFMHCIFLNILQLPHPQECITQLEVNSEAIWSVSPRGGIEWRIRNVIQQEGTQKGTTAVVTEAAGSHVSDRKMVIEFSGPNRKQCPVSNVLM